MAQQDELDSMSSVQTEKVLQRPEDYLRILLQHSHEAIELLTKDGTITYASESLQHVLGYEPQDCIGANLFSYIHPDDLEYIQERWHALLLASDTPIRAEYRARHQNGTWTWIEGTWTNHLYTGGIERIVGNFHAITWRKYAEEELSLLRAREQAIQNSETRLRRLVDSGIIGVSFTNRNGAIIDANGYFLSMTGYTKEEVIANRLNWSNLTAPEYAELDRTALEEIQQLGAVSHPYLKEYISKDGTRIPVLVGGASIDDARGEIVTFVLDMRSQKQLEEEIRKGRDQLEIILQNVANGITVHDNKGNILYANEVAAKMTGFPSAEGMQNAPFEVYQQKLTRFVVKDEEGNLVSPNNFPGRRALRERRAVQVLFEYCDTLAGNSNWSLIKSQPIFDKDGQAQLVVNVMTDVSEQQALEQRKNEFISMASHELKTPVTALKGYVNLLQRRLNRQEDQQALHYLTRMNGQLNKLANLVNDLLDLSKIQAGNFALQEEVVDLTALIEEIVENVQGTTSTHDLRFEKTADLYITGDKDRLGQVLINLLTNAIKYSPDADAVIVRAAADGEYATVSVQDFGIGITEAHQQHVFERFYQVSDPQEQTYPGLGIGLYIAYDIIKRHHGAMWVESRKGQGSTFFFTVPLAKTAIHQESTEIANESTDT